MARLILRSDAGETEHPISGGKITVGRADNVDLKIDDTKSSRKHCEVREEAGGYVLEDLGSSNGTQLNGARVEKRVLRAGDVISIGLTEIVFQLDEGEEDLAAGQFEPSGDGEDDFVLIPEDMSGPPVPIVGTVSIGRAPGNMLVISDTKASGKHCEVFIRDGVGILKDLESTNGTRVDGQKVDETPLRQGAKIAIGKTVFIFKNMALPDDEGSGLLESSALGADFAVIGKKASRRSMMGTLLALIIIGGALGGIAFLANSVTKKGTDQGVASPPGNLAKQNYSFEGDADIDGVPVGWGADVQDADAVAIVSGGRSGKKALQIQRGAPKQAGAISEVWHEEIEVNPGRAYRVKADVSAGGKAIAGLRVRWLMPQGRGPVEDAFSPLVKGDGSEYVDAVLVPPHADISKLRVSAVVFGGEGDATFDDVEVYEETPPKTGARLEAPQLALTGDGASGYDLYWGAAGQAIDELVARTIRIVAVNAQGIRGRQALGAKGSFFDAGSGTWLPYTAQAKAAERQVTLDLSVGGGVVPAGAGFTCLLNDVRLNSPVGFIDGGGYQAQSGEFTASGVTRLWLGGAHNRVGLYFEPAAQISLADDKGAPRLTVLAPADAEGGAIALKVSLQGSFDEERATAKSTLKDAKASHAAGRLGQALALFDQVATEFAFERRMATDAEKARGELRAAADSGVAELARRHDESLFPQPSVAALSQVVTRGQNLAQLWLGSEYQQKFQAIVEKAAKDLNEAKIAEGERLAASLLERGEDYGRMGQPTLARILLQKVIDDFPNTQWATDAAAALKKLPAPKGEKKDD